MGNTTVNTYIFAGALRNASNQYYPDRNLVITPTTAPSSPVKLRLFFTKAEIDEAIAGTGCGTCVAPADAYVLGISKFSGTALFENGDLSDNFANGTTIQILAAAVDIQPYDNGYYAEFAVSSFSEFWFNAGAAPLPVQLIRFEATQKNNDALLTWTTASEKNCDRFEVQRAQGDAAASRNDFETIGTVRGNGTTTNVHSYQYTDRSPQKAGNYYYRLRELDTDNSEQYSPMRVLHFAGSDDWAVQPNPTFGNARLIWKTTADTRAYLRLSNAVGQTIWEETVLTNGAQQSLDLSALQTAAAGLYYLNITTESREAFTLKIAKVE